MSESDRPSPLGSLAGTFAASWLTMVGLILITANESAVPLDFLIRPALAALIPAAAIAVVAMPFRRGRLPVAIALSAVVLLPALWPLPVALLIIEFGIWLLQRRSGKSAFAVGRFAVITVIVIAVVSAIRLVPQFADYVSGASGGEQLDSRPTYVLLLDGYPRADSLQELGIDNSAFLEELERRGFDDYPEATSAHRWTHRTLQAMVAGDPAGISDEPGNASEEQAIRAALQLPDGWLAIDPPASHVVMRGGTNVSAGGMNDFEIRLIGASVIGKVGRDLAASVIADNLRAHFERSLQLWTESPSDRTFAHVLLPHPPFIYADGVSPCWPGCNIFDVSTDKLDISRAEWADQMAFQLEAVNARVLGAVDAILDEHPDAVIVLFSDHGGRIDMDSEEVHHSFLAARTPEHPGLFDEEPHPHAILRLLNQAYP
jgi:hypothetical protein